MMSLYTSLVCAASALLLLAESTTAFKGRVLNPDVPPFMRSLSDYTYMQFDRCLRVKIQENNDDDGNSYFYNGAYRSQSQLYLAYHMCSSCGCKEGGTSYLVPAEEVLDEHIQYTQNYCNSCSNVCRRRRRLEDEEEDAGDGQYYNADCDTCIDQCLPLLKNYYEGDDETQAMECQEAYQDEDGVQYYSGPACDSNGQLTIGLFYDEDCSVKANQDGYGENFGLNTFLSFESLCISCADGLCDDVEGDGLNCVDGYNKNENVDDEMNVCKAYKKVTKEWTYASPKKNYHIPLIIALLAVVAVFFVGAYTYYVRHKKAAATEKALLEASTPADQPTKAEYAEMT